MEDVIGAKCLFGMLHILRLMDNVRKITNLRNKMKKNRRRWWVRPTNVPAVHLGISETSFAQLMEMDEEHFFQATNMTVEVFNLLVLLTKEKLTKNSYRKPIDPKMRLFITLQFLITGNSFKCLAWSHNIGVSTVRKLVYETCSALWDELHSIYLSPPSTDEWKKIAHEFYLNTCMPNCIGAVGGIRINIVCPPKGRSVLHSHEKTLSLNLLAACDSDYCFTFVDVETYSNQSVDDTMSHSTYGKQFLEKLLQVPEDDCFPGTNAKCPYYFAAANTFPLRTNLMRSYEHNIAEDQIIFNKSLSKAMAYIENTLGILVNRWRVLHHTISAHPENVDKVVLASVVLHNFIVRQKTNRYFTPDLVDRFENGEFNNGTWRNDVNAWQPIFSIGRNRSTKEASDYRNTIKQYLIKNLI